MEEKENSDTSPERAKYTYTPDEGAWDAGPGMLIMEVPGILRVEDEPAEGLAVEFRADWIEGVGVRPTGIAVISRNAKEVTSTDLRAVRAKDLWREGMVRNAKYLTLMLDGAPIGPHGALVRPDEELHLMRLNGPVGATLSYVVDLYMFADQIGLAPVQYVQQVFAGKNLEPLPRTTATKWIKRAKDMGLFEGWFDNGDD